MSYRMILKLSFAALVILIMISVISAFAANISVPSTRLTDQKSTITVNALKPTACSGVTLTTIVYCPSTGGICNGTTASELILGSSNVDVIDGKGGSDCIIGGDGNDDLTGSQSKDVCIGGPGTDTFKKCETAIQ